MTYTKGTIVSALLIVLTAQAYQKPLRHNRSAFPEMTHERRFQGLQKRFNAASMQTTGRPIVDMITAANGDLNLPNYPVFRKLFEHDPVTGELTREGIANFHKLRRALCTGDQADFNSVERLPGVIRVFITPQASSTYTLQGCDSQQFKAIAAPPAITSAAAACDLLEVYGGALCRDVHFADFGTGLHSDADGNGGSITLNVARVLNDFGAEYYGPRTADNQVDGSVLFRGPSVGDLTGPYVSQFLLQPLYPLFPAGCASFVAGAIGVDQLPQDVMAITQKRPIAQKREFGVSWEDFIDLQNGYIPKKYILTDYDQDNTRYPITPRDLGSFVHQDGPYEAYYNALNIIAYRGIPISPNFPYANGTIRNESAGINLGTPDAFSLLAVTSEAFHAAWALKWLCHWRLRPEEMAGFVHYAKISNTNIHNVHSSLFALHDGIDLLELVRARNLLQILPEYDPQLLLNSEQANTYLLALMYPEGSPEHPSFVSAHAAVAGACVTVIKAMYDDTVLMRDYMTPVTVNPVDPQQLIPLVGNGEDTMTLAGELDKLATNMATARMFSGVHYRSDGEQGILLGELVAIYYLQDQARKYTESGFNGFQLTKRDGTRIAITADSIKIIR